MSGKWNWRVYNTDGKETLKKRRFKFARLAMEESMLYALKRKNIIRVDITQEDRYENIIRYTRTRNPESLQWRRWRKVNETECLK